LLGKTSKQQEKLYHDFWLKIEKNLSGDDKTFSVSAFIRDYMQMFAESAYKKATENGSNSKELYQDFKELFEGFDNHEEQLQELAEHSNEYAILAGYKSSGNDEIDLKIADIKTVESSSFYSFILKLLRLRTEGRINDGDCLAILDAIFIYVERRRILQLTQGENNSIPQLVRYFSDLIQTDNKRTKMFAILSDQQHALRLPNNDDIKAYLLSPESNFYALRSGKFLQSLIEESLTKSRPNLRDKNLQVEHIMPRTLNSHWKRELGTNYQEIHDKYLNNIGNLTLIRHNQELGNRSFSEKKEIYKHNSGMQIAKEKIENQEKWSEAEIKNRARYMIDVLLDSVLSVADDFKVGINYSITKKSKNNRLSFRKLGLIGREIYLFEEPTITATVVGDKDLMFENKRDKLSPLTREIMRRLGKINKSGSYWGADKWGYNGKTLYDLMQELPDEDDQDDSDGQNDGTLF
jgi:hypothetical protein